MSTDPRTQRPAAFTDQPGIAAMLSISRASLRRMIIKGEFPPADLVLSKTCLRWRISTVENWLDQHQAQPGRGGAR